MTTDTAAWVGELYTDHHKRILNYLVGRTHDRDLAEDLAAETFMRAVRSAHTFRYGTPLAWLTTIARNVHFDHLKSARNKREELVDEYPRDAATNDMGPDLAVLASEDAEFSRLASTVIAERIAALPTREAEILQLRLLRGLSTEQTARILGVSTDTVKVTRWRGVTRIQGEGPLRIHRTNTRRARRCQWTTGCSLAIAARGLCIGHYKMLRRVDQLPDSDLVDPAPTRRHITAYVERGGALHHLAAISGVTRATLAYVHTGRHATVHKAAERQRYAARDRARRARRKATAA